MTEKEIREKCEEAIKIMGTEERKSSQMIEVWRHETKLNNQRKED